MQLTNVDSFILGRLKMEISANRSLSSFYKPFFPFFL